MRINEPADLLIIVPSALGHSVKIAGINIHSNKQ